MTALEVEGLTKVYRGGLRANDDVTVAVEGGEVFGLLGPNGAGKTTLVKQVVGSLRPTEGRIRIDGADVVSHPGYARRVCSYQPQTRVPVTGLTPMQAIELVGRLRGGGPTATARRTEELVEGLDLGPWTGTQGDDLSGGILRLVAFCMAAVVPGRVVICDEPTNDVDPRRRHLLWGRIRALADEGTAVLLVTHNVLEAERAVDRLAILDRGRVVASGSPAALKARLGGALRFEATVEPGAGRREVDACLRRPVWTGRRLVAELDPVDVGRAVDWARSQPWFEEFAVGPATLEDAYLRLVEEPVDAHVAA